MKLIGVLFIVLSSGSVGYQISRAMKTRCRLLRNLQSSVCMLKNEIIVCATPLPQAFALMGASLNGAIGKLFSDVAHRMNKHRWITVLAAMEEAIEADNDLKKDEKLRRELRNMAEGLGKYDKDAQASILDQTIERLGTMIEQAEQEQSIKSKTYEVLGLCAGLSLIILLM